MQKVNNSYIMHNILFVCMCYYTIRLVNVNYYNEKGNGKMKYENPEMEIIEFKEPPVDILTVSGQGEPEIDGSGGW